MANREYRVRIPSYARAHFGGKHRVAQRFADPEAAELWMEEIKSDLRRLRIGAERKSVHAAPVAVHPFDLIANAWLGASEAAESTRGWYRTMLDKHAIPQLQQTPINTIGRNALQAMMRRLRDGGASGDTVAKVRGIVVMVLKWAAGNGFAIDPTVMATKAPRALPTVQRRYDPEIMGKILEAASPEDRVVLEIALLTGMRGGELRAFRVEWIQWAARQIHVEATTRYAPKSRRPRAIPMPKRLERILREHLGDREEGLVFQPRRAGRSGTGKTAGIYLRGLIARVRKAAGIAIRGIHDLRHYYISHLAALGVPPREIQEIAGHKDLATTMLYMHAAPNYLASSRDALDRDEAKVVSIDVAGGRRSGLKGRR